MFGTKTDVNARKKAMALTGIKNSPANYLELYNSSQAIPFDDSANNDQFIVHLPTGQVPVMQIFSSVAESINFKVIDYCDESVKYETTLVGELITRSDQTTYYRFKNGSGIILPYQNGFHQVVIVQSDREYRSDVFKWTDNLSECVKFYGSSSNLKFGDFEVFVQDMSSFAYDFWCFKFPEKSESKNDYKAQEKQGMSKILYGSSLFQRHLSVACTPAMYRCLSIFPLFLGNGQITMFDEGRSFRLAELVVESGEAHEGGKRYGVRVTATPDEYVVSIINKHQQ